MSQAEIELEHQRYLSLRKQAHADWQRLAQHAALVAEQFMNDSPHGGDLQALHMTFVSARQKTQEVVAQYRVWLIKQQGG